MFRWCLLSLLAVAGAARHHDGHRRHRDVTAGDSLHIQVANLVGGVKDIRRLRSLADIEARVGDVHDYVTSKLTAVTKLLKKLSEKELTEQETEHATQLVHTIQSLGFVWGRVFRQNENRGLRISSVTMAVSRFHPHQFTGAQFMPDGQSDSISIPNSATFPSSLQDDVISVSYSVSDVISVMPRKFNDSLGSSIISTTYLDQSGNELTPSVSDSVTVALSLADAVPEGEEPICSFLQFTNEGVGSWSSSPVCETEYPVQNKEGIVHCHCTHLLTYGILFADKVEIAEIGAAAWVGCSVTILCCLITALIFIGYRLMNSARCYIRFSFLLALALGEMLFLCIKYKESPVICTMIALGIHFFSLSSFTWALSYALFLGNDLSGDMEASFHLAHYTFLGWAIPFFVVLITFIWKYDSYVQEQYCWISQFNEGLRYAYIVPICIVVVATVIVLMYDITIYLRINDPKKQEILRIVRSGLRSCCCLLPVVAAVWLLADLVIVESTLWLQVLLSVVNVILGVMIFLIMFYFNEEIKMKRKNGKIKKIKPFKSIQGGGPKRDRGIQMKLLWSGFSKSSRSPEVERREVTPVSEPRPLHGTSSDLHPSTSPAQETSVRPQTGPSPEPTDDKAKMIPVEDSGPRSPNRRSREISAAREMFFLGAEPTTSST